MRTLPTVEGYAVRGFAPGVDYPALTALLNAASVDDHRDVVVDESELRHQLAHTSGLDPERDVVVAEVGRALVAVVVHEWRARGRRVFHELRLVVLPAERRQGLGRALLGWAEGHAADGVAAGLMGPPDVPHVLAAWADLDTSGVRPFAAATGYAIEGYGVTMSRPLADPIPDIPLPDDLHLRPVRAEDYRRIWEADSEAFTDDIDPAVRTESDFARWFESPDLDTSAWAVAWDGDEVAGSAWNQVYGLENARLGLRRGYLEHLSVRRPWRRRGLGTALIAHSLRSFRDLGLDSAVLSANAENVTGAVRLYESLGFRRIRTTGNFQKGL